MVAMTPDRQTFRRLLWAEFAAISLGPLYPDDVSRTPRRSAARRLFGVAYFATVLGFTYWLSKDRWQVTVVASAGGAGVGLLMSFRISWREARRVMRVLELARRARGAAA